MKNLQKIETNIDKRVKQAIEHSMQLYMNKLNSGVLELGLEDSFKMHLANIIDAWLNLYILFSDESVTVHFEKNIPINNNKDYIDIVIQYKRGTIEKLYPIELKFKKITDSAPDLGNIYSYIDIFNLDCHKKSTKNISKCYFIFLTDYETYTKMSTKGTRTDIPMYDGYRILQNKPYTVSTVSAKKNTAKYPNGFLFSNDYEIQYQKFSIKGKDYWFYILEI